VKNPVLYGGVKIIFTDGGLIHNVVFTCVSAKILPIKNKKQTESMVVITFDRFIFM